MPINFTDFSRAPIQNSPLKNIFEDALKGYQIGQAPAQMARVKQQEELANKLKELALAHQPTEYSLSDQLKRAQINHANRAPVIGGALGEAFRLRESLPKGSMEYNQVNSYIDKLSHGSGGIQFSSTPEGGFSVNIGGSGEGENQVGMAGLPPLSKGQSYAKDLHTGQVIGVNTPFTAPELKQFQGKESFNSLFPFLNKSLSSYSGRHSWKKFAADSENYDSDPEARDRIDNFLAAQKLLSAETVTETARIGGSATNKQLQLLRDSLDSSEVPDKLQFGSTFVLPEGYAKRSGEIFQNKLNEAAAKAEQVPQFRVRYFNAPQAQNASQGINSSASIAAPLQKFKPKSEFKDKQQFMMYISSLSPQDKAEAKKFYLGGK